MYKKRLEIIINNLLDEIINKTDMYTADKETYYSWLETEIGMTKEEIEELKNDLDGIPEPPEEYY